MSQELTEFELYKQVIDRAPVHIYWKDKDFRYIACNKLQAEDLGFKTSEELIGKTDYDLYLKEHADEIRKNDEQVVQKGIPYIYEEKGPGEHGPNSIYLTQKIPLLNNDNQIIGLAGISVEITLRRQEEERIRAEKEEAELTLASILDKLPGHVYWKNKDSVYQGCNLAQARSAGFRSPEEMIGKTDYEMPWSHEASILRESDLLVMKTKTTLTREEASKLAHSNKVSIFLSKKSPLVNKKGEVIGILGISFDITDRKKMEASLLKSKEAAEAANKSKTAFIANMSHDIRTPMSGVIGMAKLLETEGDTEKDREFGHVIHTSSEHLLILLNDILDVIAADSTRPEDLKLETFSLRDRLKHLKELMLSNMKSVQITFHVEVDPEVPDYVVSDRLKFDRILLNLASNALKFTHDGQITVRIAVYSKDDHSIKMQIDVSDTGIGISKDQQKKIFDQFYRVSPSYDNKYQGHGIGLFIVKKFVSALSGKIKVKSEPGKGSTFTIILPMKVGTKQDVQASPQDIIPHLFIPPAMSNNPKPPDEGYPHQTAKKGLKGLLIEDNALASRVAKTLLERTGFQIQTAASAEEGFKLLLDNYYNFVVTDIGLPGMDGNQFTFLARQWEKVTHRKPIPIIGLSAHSQNKEAKLAGMNILMQKPLDERKIDEISERFFSKPKSPPPTRVRKKAVASSKLGIDLPNTEQELFELERYSLLDEADGIDKSGGSREMLKELLDLLANETIPEETAVLKKAHEDGDWDSIQKIAHKLKGGALYCGTHKLRYACQYMERYLLAGHSRYKEQLYDQLNRVLTETWQRLCGWLKSNK